MLRAPVRIFSGSANDHFEEAAGLETAGHKAPGTKPSSGVVQPRYIMQTAWVLIFL
jgi:hypothetical protein